MTVAIADLDRKLAIGFVRQLFHDRKRFQLRLGSHIYHVLRHRRVLHLCQQLCQLHAVDDFAILFKKRVCHFINLHDRISFLYLTSIFRTAPSPSDKSV